MHLKWICCFLLLGFFCANAQNAKQPNIIIILADDLGFADVGFNGGDIETPNIDLLAENGKVLNRFYADMTCTPSRVGLMSGRFAAREGLAIGVISPKCGDGLDPDLYILPEMLRDAGYTNRSCIGKWHLGHSNIKYHPLEQGFTHFYGHYGGMVDYFTHKRVGEVDWHRNYDFCADEGYATDLITNEAVKQIGDWANIDAPYFMYIAYNAPHTPLQAKIEDLKAVGYKAKDGSFALKNDEFRKLPAKGRGNDKRQTYKAMVTALDKGVGQIIDALKTSGDWENTFIIFYSDNGGYAPNGGDNGGLRGGKGTYYEGGVRVAAVVHYPDMIEEAGEVDNMISHIDLFPTLMELADADESKLQNRLDGINILPILSFKKEEPVALDYERILYLSKHALATQRWKLVKGELFNVEEDEKELIDVSKDFPVVFKSLTKQLDFLKVDIENPIKRNYKYKVLPNWEMPR